MRERFYNLRSLWPNKYFTGQVKTHLDMRTLAKQGMKGFKGVLHVEITDGTIAGDFLEVGLPPLIVSSKVVDTLKNFMSFQTYPVIIEGGVSPIEYTGLVFLGRGGPFDPVKSKAVYYKGPGASTPPAILSKEGMYFDDSKWDGSDLFTIDEFPCVPIVTERVAKEMKKAGITNCQYTPLEERGIFKK